MCHIGAIGTPMCHIGAIAGWLIDRRCQGGEIQGLVNGGMATGLEVEPIRWTLQPNHQRNYGRLECLQET